MTIIGKEKESRGELLNILLVTPTKNSYTTETAKISKEEWARLKKKILTMGKIQGNDNLRWMSPELMTIWHHELKKYV